jgi:hypothetical protein
MTFGETASAPWQAWQAAALAFALCGVLLHVVCAVTATRVQAVQQLH